MAPPRDRVVTAAAFARPKLQLEHPLLYFRDEPLVVVRRGNAATARQFQADFKFSKRTQEAHRRHWVAAPYALAWFNT